MVYLFPSPLPKVVSAIMAAQTTNGASDNSRWKSTSRGEMDCCRRGRKSSPRLSFASATPIYQPAPAMDYPIEDRFATPCLRRKRKQYIAPELRNRWPAQRRKVHHL